MSSEWAYQRSQDILPLTALLIWDKERERERNNKFRNWMKHLKVLGCTCNRLWQSVLQRSIRLTPISLISRWFSILPGQFLLSIILVVCDSLVCHLIVDLLNPTVLVDSSITCWLYNALQCNAMQCNAMQCNAMQKKCISSHSHKLHLLNGCNCQCCENRIPQKRFN